MPITFTLNQLKRRDLCEAGWDAAHDMFKLPENLSNSSGDIDYNIPVSGIEYIEKDMIPFMYILAGLSCLTEYDFLWAKYAFWCNKQVQHLLSELTEPLTPFLIGFNPSMMEFAAEGAFQIALKTRGPEEALKIRKDQKAKLLEICIAEKWVE